MRQAVKDCLRHPRNERRALDTGFDMFRAKPISAEDVATAVLALVEQRRLPGRRVRRVPELSSRGEGTGRSLSPRLR